MRHDEPYFLYFSIGTLIIILTLTVLFSGCTISLNNTQATGHASDTVDEAQSASASPNFSIPVPLI